MTLTEARKVLGLGPDEDPWPHMEEFGAVREKIANMVRTAPNEMLAARYQDGLVEFDRALAAVKEHLEALGLVQREEDVKTQDGPPKEKGQSVFIAANEVSDSSKLPVFSAPQPQPPSPRSRPVVAVEHKDTPSSGKGARIIIIGLLLLLAVIGLAGWGYLEVEENREMEKQARVALLERQGSVFIENRRWPEAVKAFDEIEKIDPKSDLVAIGRRSIEAGMLEEQSQLIAYWKGEAIASLEAGRWADAQVAAKTVLEKYPEEQEIIDLLGKIDIAMREEERQRSLERVRQLMKDRKFDEALSAARQLIEADESDEKSVALLNEVREAKERAEQDLARANQLLARAVESDTGEFNEQALEWLREAVSLAPDSKEILARYEKMASYTRTIRVPQDVKTVQEALAAARDRDRLVLAEGTWQGPFVVTAAVELEGVAGKTILECPADAGSVITIQSGVQGARVSGLTIRHLSFDAGEERFSLALVTGATADFSDCRFEQGSGHGLAVIGGGAAKVLRCRFTENGWNGIAVMGAGSSLEAEGNTMRENFQNGIESWNEASVILTKNTCTANSRNGIHVDTGAGSASIRENILSENREFGMVIGSAASGEVTGNVLEQNMLGGLVLKAKAAQVVVKDNQIQNNEGPGLVLEMGMGMGMGMDQALFAGNRVNGNGGKQLMSGVDFSEAEAEVEVEADGDGDGAEMVIPKAKIVEIEE